MGKLVVRTEGDSVVLELADSGLEIALRRDRAHELAEKLENAAWDLVPKETFNE